MKVLQYLASLLPTFGRDQVLEDCRITRAEISEGTLPAYVAAAELFKGWKFKSKDLDQKFKTFARMTHSHGGNFVDQITKGLKQAVDNLTAVEDLIRKTYNEDVASAGLTYQKAQLLQFVEFAGFASKYARKFLVLVYVLESSQFKDSGSSVSESITAAEMKWLEQNFISFCTAMNVVSTGDAKLRKAITDIPDIMVTKDNAGTLGSTVGEAKLDPLQMRLIPLALNPIYHVRMAVAEWQANRYKAAHEEVKLLQLRKLNLERLSAGKADAKLQQEINYLERRISGLNFKIAEMERAYA